MGSRSSPRDGLRPSTPNRPASISSYARHGASVQGHHLSGRFSGASMSSDNMYRLLPSVLHSQYEQPSSQGNSYDVTRRLQRHSEEPPDTSEPQNLASSGTRLSSVRFPSHSTSLDGTSPDVAAAHCASPPPPGRSSTAAPTTPEPSMRSITPGDTHASEPLRSPQRSSRSGWGPNAAAAAYAAEAAEPASSRLQRSNRHSSLPSSLMREHASLDGVHPSRSTTPQGSPQVRTVVNAPHGGVVTVFRSPHRQGSSGSPGPMHWRHHNSTSSSRVGVPLGEGTLPESAGAVSPPLCRSPGVANSTMVRSGSGRSGTSTVRSGSLHLSHAGGSASPAGGTRSGGSGARPAFGPEITSRSRHGSGARSRDGSARDAAAGGAPRVVTAPDGESDAPAAVTLPAILQVPREPLETLMERSHQMFTPGPAADARQQSGHTVFALTSFGFSSSLSGSAGGSSEGRDHEDFSFSRRMRAPVRQRSTGTPSAPLPPLLPLQQRPLATLARAATAASHSTTPSRADSSAGGGLWDSLPLAPLAAVGSPHATDDPSTSFAYLNTGGSTGRASSSNTRDEATVQESHSVSLPEPGEPMHAPQRSTTQPLSQIPRQPLQPQRSAGSALSLDPTHSQTSAVRSFSSQDDAAVQTVSSHVSSVDAHLPMPPLGASLALGGMLRPPGEGVPAAAGGGTRARHGAGTRQRDFGSIPRGGPAAVAMAALQQRPRVGQRRAPDMLSSSDGMAPGQTTTYDGSSDRSPADGGSIVLPPPPMMMPLVRSHHHPHLQVPPGPLPPAMHTPRPPPEFMNLHCTATASAVACFRLSSPCFDIALPWNAAACGRSPQCWTGAAAPDVARCPRALVL